MKHFKTSLLVMLPVLGILAFAGCNQTNDETSTNPTTSETEITDTTSDTAAETGNGTETTTFETFENPTQGYNINYPDNWVVQEDPSSGVNGFIAPTQSTDTTNFSNNVNVVVQSLGEETYTLETYTEATITNLQASNPTLVVEESTDTTLSGQPAHRSVYTGSQLGFDLKWMQVWTLTDEAVYIITYTADQAHFDDDLENAQKMIESLEIL